MFSSMHRLVSRQSCLLCSYHVHLTIALAGPAEEVVQATPRLPHDHVSYHVRSRLVGSSVSHMLSYAHTHASICDEEEAACTQGISQLTSRATAL